jgi:hypothetical protein
LRRRRSSSVDLLSRGRPEDGEGTALPRDSRLPRISDSCLAISGGRAGDPARPAHAAIPRWCCSAGPCHSCDRRAGLSRVPLPARSEHRAAIHHGGDECRQGVSQSYEHRDDRGGRRCPIEPLQEEQQAGRFAALRRMAAMSTRPEEEFLASYRKRPNLETLWRRSRGSSAARSGRIPSRRSETRS